MKHADCNFDLNKSKEEMSYNSFFLKENDKYKYLPLLNLIRTKQFNKARTELNRLLKSTPDKPNLYNLLALLESLEGNNDAAKQNYQKALGLDKKNISAYLGLAKLLIAEQELNSAKINIQKVLKINQNNISAHMALAAIANLKKNYKEAEEHLLRSYKKASKNYLTEIYIASELAKWYEKHNKPTKLISLAQELEKKYPEKIDVLAFKAAAEITTDHINLAEATLKRIVSLDKSDTKHRLMLANILSKQANRSEETLKLLDQVQAIRPNDARPLIVKASFFLSQKKHTETLNIINSAKKLFPSESLIHQLEGDLFLEQKNIDKALNSYQEAFRLKKSYRVLSLLADLLVSQKKENEAISLLQDQLQINSANIEVNLKLASIYQKIEKQNKAIIHYQKILDASPNNILALNNLALLLIDSNKNDSLMLAKKAFDLAPDKAVIIDTYGYILTKLGHYKDGLKILEKSALLAPHIFDIQYHYADVLHLTGNKSKAIAILEKISGSNKNFLEKRASIELLNKLR